MSGRYIVDVVLPVRAFRDTMGRAPFRLTPDQCIRVYQETMSQIMMVTDSDTLTSLKRLVHVVEFNRYADIHSIMHHQRAFRDAVMTLGLALVTILNDAINPYAQRAEYILESATWEYICVATIDRYY